MTLKYKYFHVRETNETDWTEYYVATLERAVMAYIVSGVQFVSFSGSNPEELEVREAGEENFRVVRVHMSMNIQETGKTVKEE